MRREYWFVDPDDNIGPHFVESFMREMTEQYDFIAMGFFQNDNGIYKACPLAGDAVYAGKEIDGLKKSFLYDFQNLKVSNRVYISRWHKLYRYIVCWMKNIMRTLLLKY